jgi:iron transport multicopper oxidase
MLRRDTYLVALCTGVFAATAITSAPNLTALVPIAAEMVLVAFRAGYYVSKMAEILGCATEEAESWTYLVPDTSESKIREVLEHFHTSCVRKHISPICRVQTLTFD